MKNQANMVSQKENSNSPATELKGMEYCDLTDKECKIVIMKKFNKLQENSERKLNELRNEFNDHKFFIKETEILKKNQIRKQKNSVNEMKNALASMSNRSDGRRNK